MRSPVVFFLFAIPLVGGAMSGCSRMNLAGDYIVAAGGSTGSTGSLGVGGGGGGYLATTSTSTGGTGGADYIPPVNNSYSFLCGGNQDTCVPGSLDPMHQCAPLANPSGDGGFVDHVSCVIEPGQNGVTDTCVIAGMFQRDEPCQSATDCDVGLGCVKTKGGGVCEPYCCEDIDACSKGSYCAPQRMAEGAAPTPLIPVCIAASNCKLLDDTTCDPGLTCTIVRSDGTTSCVVPGKGQQGDPCPCAPGFVCSNFDSTCLKLCHTGSNECGDSLTCTGGMNGYPADVGTCAP